MPGEDQLALHIESALRQRGIVAALGFEREPVAQSGSSQDVGPRTHHPTRSAWPGQRCSLTGILANNAAGVFIWAVTVVKFIKREINIPGIGARHLPQLMQSLSQQQLGDIRSLYHRILSRMYYCGKGDIDQLYLQEEELKVQDLHQGGLIIFRGIMGLIVAMQQEQEQINRFIHWKKGWKKGFNDFFSVAKLNALLKFRNADGPFDLYTFLDNLSTLFDWRSGLLYPEMHRSLIDFLLSPSPFCIDLMRARAELSHLCLSVFQESGELIALSLSVSFSIQFLRHLQIAYKPAQPGDEPQRNTGMALWLGYSVSPRAEYRWHLITDNTRPVLIVHYSLRDRLQVVRYQNRKTLAALGLEDCHRSPYLLPDYLEHSNRMHHFAFLHYPIQYEKPKGLSELRVTLLALNPASTGYHEIALDLRREVKIQSNTMYRLHISNQVLVDLGFQFYFYVFFHRQGENMAVSLCDTPNTCFTHFAHLVL